MTQKCDANLYIIFDVSGCPELKKKQVFTDCSFYQKTWALPQLFTYGFEENGLQNDQLNLK